jgi:hypothetical protein
MGERVVVRAQDLGCGCLARRGARRANEGAEAGAAVGRARTFVLEHGWAASPSGSRTTHSSTGVRQTGRERRH